MFLLCVCGTAYAGEQSLPGVAVEALKNAFNTHNGEIWEHGGIIFKRGWWLMTTSPAISDSSPDSLWISPKNLKGPSDVLVGIFHTHPCFTKSHFSNYFSVPDIAQSLYLRVPTFILDECSGIVHEFDPEVDDPEATQIVVAEHYLVAGRVVGNIGQTGRDLDNN